jgi:hypothetical protein
VTYPLPTRFLCPLCGERIEGLLDYDNHRREHEARAELARARARSRTHKEAR